MSGYGLALKAGANVPEMLAPLKNSGFHSHFLMDNIPTFLVKIYPAVHSDGFYTKTK